MSEPEAPADPSAAEPPWRVRLVQYGLALLIAAIGGVLFNAIGMPLAFMLGAMTFCAVAAILGAPVRSPGPIRPPMAAMVGAMLGANFTAEIITEVPRWIIPMVGLAFFMLACALASVTYLRRVAGYDATTAYFAGMPGGLVDMAMIGDSMGGDMRKIAMTHATRIMLIVFTVPFAVRHITGADLPAVQRSAVSLADVEPTFFLWLVGTCIAGVAIAKLIRLPAQHILGPMLVSAFIHAMGWTDYRLPFELVILAQIVLGATIGCRFLGVKPRDIGMMVVAGVGSTVILIAITAVFSFGVSLVSGIGMPALFLAYSPGGFIEMGLVALAVGIEIAFVAAHHAVRIMLVGLFAPVTFFALRKRRGA